MKIKIILNKTTSTSSVSLGLYFYLIMFWKRLNIAILPHEPNIEIMERIKAGIIGFLATGAGLDLMDFWWARNRDRLEVSWKENYFKGQRGIYCYITTVIRIFHPQSLSTWKITCCQVTSV